MPAADVELRRRIFAFFEANQRAPTAGEVGATTEDFLGLQERHALVVDAGGGIVIANPFSGAPTDYVVESGGRSWFASCCWDALGADGVTRSHCPDCGEALELRVAGGELRPSPFVAHFLVPARRWYDDLGFT
jgi:alkylmercury lyase-like protein